MRDDVATMLDSDAVDRFWRFVAERQRVWWRMVVERAEPPWTEDETIQGFYFTNVYRELDPGTQYAIQDILERDAARVDRLFNVLIYRLIGRLETHKHLGFQTVDGFEQDRFAARLKQRRDEEDEPIFTGAYMVAGYHQMGSDDKVENIARLFSRVRDQLPETLDAVDAADRLQDVFGIINDLPGFGDFLSYQVVVDLLYPLSDGDAFLPYSPNDWARAGPGAKKGIRMLTETDGRLPYLPIMRWLQEQQADAFDRLGINFPHLLDGDGAELPLSLANIQNCCCEFHKYEKIQDNPRRARRRFSEADDLQAREGLIELYQDAPNITLPQD